MMKLKASATIPTSEDENPVVVQAFEREARFSRLLAALDSVASEGKEEGAKGNAIRNSSSFHGLGLSATQVAPVSPRISGSGGPPRKALPSAPSLDQENPKRVAVRYRGAPGHVQALSCRVGTSVFYGTVLARVDARLSGVSFVRLLITFAL